MASSTRSWQEDAPRSPVEMELAVEQSIERQWSWMVPFVKAQLGLSASPYDFKDRIVQSLARHWRGTLEPQPFDEAVRKELKQCMHDDRRTAFRRAQKQGIPAETEQIPDPRSLDFVSRLERNSQLDLVRKYIQDERPDYQPIVDKLFGFHDEEEVKVAELAEQLGIPTDTLRHRLYRFYAELQVRLSRLPRKS